MKKIFLAFIMIIWFFWLSMSSFAYTLNQTDINISETLTQRVEKVITQRWERFRQPFIKAIENLANKNKSKPRIHAIYSQVALNLDTSFISDFENVLGWVKNDFSSNIKKVFTDIKYYWDVNEIKFSDDWRDILVYTSKWKWEQNTVVSLFIFNESLFKSVL